MSESSRPADGSQPDEERREAIYAETVAIRQQALRDALADTAVSVQDGGRDR